MLLLNSHFSIRFHRFERNVNFFTWALFVIGRCIKRLPKIILFE